MRSPRPRPWYRPAVQWEWASPWWGLRRFEELEALPGLLPVRSFYIGPLVLIWMGKTGQNQRSPE